MCCFQHITLTHATSTMSVNPNVLHSFFSFCSQDLVLNGAVCRRVSQKEYPQRNKSCEVSANRVSLERTLATDCVPLDISLVMKSSTVVGHSFIRMASKTSPIGPSPARSLCISSLCRRITAWSSSMAGSRRKSRATIPKAACVRRAGTCRRGDRLLGRSRSSSSRSLAFSASRVAFVTRGMTVLRDLLKVLEPKAAI